MYRLKQLTLLGMDMLLLYVGLYLAIALRHLSWPPEQRIFDALLLPMSILFILAAVALFIAGLYDVGRARNSVIFYQKLWLAALLWVVVSTLYFYTNPTPTVTPKTILLLTAILGFGLISIWRFLYNRFLSTVIWKTEVVFAGITPEVIELSKTLHHRPERGLNIYGFLTKDSSVLPGLLASYPTGTSLAELKHTNKNNHPSIVVIAPGMEKNELLLEELYETLFAKVSVVDLADFYSETLARIPPFTFSESWFITHLREQEKKVYDRLRILTDYFVSLIVGVVFIATLIPISLLVKLTSRGPIFFRQKRVGRAGRTFSMYKYRTMKAVNKEGSAESTGPVFAASKDPRITMAGRFLRRTRLDELPQFINILKGEMALIGPRPERPEFVEQLTEVMPFYHLRHLIKPGITGWAQLQHSYYGTIEENLQKLEYDLYYVKNRGPVLDISIALKTFSVLIRFAGR